MKAAIPANVVRREHEVEQLTRALTELERELATIPAAKVGTAWHTDRVAERKRLMRTLAARGALN